ncbi:hypothetical protein FB451DRAFT_1264701 [Mycena latifolia]|nr:hypothetical protein FB451DRAFT_1264701 [Mycena latifolia]
MKVASIFRSPLSIPPHKTCLLCAPLNAPFVHLKTLLCRPCAIVHPVRLRLREQLRPPRPHASRGGFRRATSGDPCGMARGHGHARLRDVRGLDQSVRSLHSLILHLSSRAKCQTVGLPPLARPTQLWHRSRTPHRAAQGRGFPVDYRWWAYPYTTFNNLSPPWCRCTPSPGALFAYPQAHGTQAGALSASCAANAFTGPGCATLDALLVLPFANVATLLCVVWAVSRRARAVHGEGPILIPARASKPRFAPAWQMAHVAELEPLKAQAV